MMVTDGCDAVKSSLYSFLVSVLSWTFEVLLGPLHLLAIESFQAQRPSLRSVSRQRIENDIARCSGLCRGRCARSRSLA